MGNPLHALHEAADAEFQPYGDVPVVSTFGEPQAEYAAIRKGAAVMDRPHRGVLELRGKDRLAFLNNLLTNQTWDKAAKKGLAAGQCVYSFFLNTKGRIVADMNVIELGEATLIETDQRLLETLRQALEKFIFGEQVSIENQAAALHQLLLAGPAALGVLRRVAEGETPELAVMSAARVKLLGQEVVIFRDDVCGVPGYTLIMPVAAANELWDRLTASESKAEDEAQFMRFSGLARPVGWAAFNATRIEAGRALFGIDFAEPALDGSDPGVLPAETGQVTFGRAVSLTKGCYLGQEIVARMHSRGQLARQLAGIRMDGDALPVAGTKVFDAQQNEVGGVTSSTLSPVLSNAAICLGYVKRPLYAEGSKVIVPAEGALREGTVVPLPFLR